jgi:hypothetical protein
VRKNYQRKERKSNHKFEVVRGQELLVQVPLPMAEVWAVSAILQGSLGPETYIQFCFYKRIRRSRGYCRSWLL